MLDCQSLPGAPGLNSLHETPWHMCEINNPFSPQVGFDQGFIITTERLVRIPGNGPWWFVLYLAYFPTACPALLSLVPSIPKLLTLQSNAEASRGLLSCCQWVSVQRSAVFFSQNRPGVWQWDGLSPSATPWLHPRTFLCSLNNRRGFPVTKLGGT